MNDYFNIAHCRLFGIRLFFGIIIGIGIGPTSLLSQQKHIYLANDNHTDIFWSGTEAEYRGVAIREIDYYLNLTELTAGLPSEFQSRYNLDGAWYVHAYQQGKSGADFNRLLDRVRSGHFSFPLNYYVSTYGGQPTEAVLRGMYWSGKLARQHDLDLELAVSMENQTQPLGLASLWAGAGARYSWKGVCGCSSPVSNGLLANREHECYRYRGLDGSEVLMKWYSFEGFANLGGYAEARLLPQAVTKIDFKLGSPQYPYLVGGAFGYGEDQLEAKTDVFPLIAQQQTTADRQVYVSNEVDFFRHFETTYPVDELPAESVTYGNDWDTDCASLAPVTTRIRNSVEKLRTAESLASIVSLSDTAFYPSLDSARMRAWIALGSYWEHNFGLGGCCVDERAQWQQQLEGQVTGYVDSLYAASLEKLGRQIEYPGGAPRFFVFNSLGWPRTDYADLPYQPGEPAIRVLDVQTGQEVPHEFLNQSGKSWLRILAADVPSVGYKVFEIRAGNPDATPESASLEGQIFENPYYRLEVTSEGVITSLIDKTDGKREYVKEQNGRFLNDFGQGNRNQGQLTLLHNGPVSATIQCMSASPLQHTTTITLYRAIKRIDISNRINDTFGDEIRTYSFSFNVETPTVWHEELGAVLKAKYTTGGGHYATMDQPARHDWQTLNHFADVGNQNQGVVLSNRGAAFMKIGDSSLGFLDQNSPQINVLIGGRMAGSGPGFANQFGLTDFDNSFSLQTRPTSFDAAADMQFALEHQNPLVAGLLNGAEGVLPDTSFSLLKISHPKVLLWALKPAEEGVNAQGMILRLWNLDTLDHICTADFLPNVNNAHKTTHLEIDLAPATINQGNLELQAGQQRIQSFRVFLDPLAFGCVERTTISQSICEGEEFEGFTKSGIYVDTLTASNGCDSIRTLELVVRESFRDSTFVEICAGEVIFWNGAEYSLPGSYADTLTMADGCDSILYLELIVNEVYRDTTYAEICAGELYPWNGAEYDLPGSYADTLTMTNGCDSILVLELVVKEVYRDTTNAEICAGEVYPWNGAEYDLPGLYADTLTTTGGCDSILVLELVVKEVYRDTTYAEICAGEVYPWNGAEYDLPGLYADTLTTTGGCDSILVLELVVKEVYRETTYAEICAGEVYPWNGSVYDLPGLYADTLTTTGGCDSILVLELVVKEVFRETTYAEICSGEVYPWQGSVYDLPGLYADTLTTAGGCDSILVLELVVKEVFRETTYTEICSGEVYPWNGSVYDLPGLYADTLTTAGGCDSILVLELVVNEEFRDTTYAEICSGEVYPWNGAVYDLPGLYADTLATAGGCDSILVLELAVIPVSDTTFLTTYTCLESEAGTREEILTNQSGCDSVIQTSVRYEALEYVVVAQPATCMGIENGSVRIESEGNYFYQWSNGMEGPELTELPAGRLTLVVRDPKSGCTTTEEITIGEEFPLVVDIMGLDNYCFGGFASAFAEGGLPPYAYLWNTGDTSQTITGTEAGIYFVEMRDARGCRGMGEVNIIDHDTLLISAVRQDVSCAGAADGRVEVTVVGGVLPYEIQWSHGPSVFQLEGLGPGDYIYSVSDREGCSISKMVTIRAPEALSLNLEVEDASATGNDGTASVRPAGGTPPYVVEWSNGAMGETVDGLLPGMYAVSLTDGKGCSLSSDFEIGVLSTISSISSLDNFELFPNPASDIVRINVRFLQPEQASFLLLDSAGKILLRQSFQGIGYQTDLELGALPPGGYQVWLLVGREKAVRSIIVQ